MMDFGVIGKRTQWVAITAAVTIILSLVSWVAWLRPNRPNVPRGCLFANERTGELIVEPLDAVSPMQDLHGDPILVRAAVYSLDGGKTKQAAYYEKYTDEARRSLDNPASTPAESDLISQGDLVRLSTVGSPWVSAESDAGRRVIATLPQGNGVTQCSIVLR